MAWSNRRPQNRKKSSGYHHPSVPLYSHDFEVDESTAPVVQHRDFPVESYKRLFETYSQCCDYPMIMVESVGEDEYHADGTYDVEVLSVYCMYCGCSLVCADDFP